ncbi:hypothetical protein BDV59DRAFT_171847 [Aspergillus ambiguus]|uniref:uncharacterized protein n=1 Tax=Aspergillus ambiguus TaxID=176160 RepID=UPI003CCE3F5A
MVIDQMPRGHPNLPDFSRHDFMWRMISILGCRAAFRFGDPAVSPHIYGTRLRRSQRI